MTTEQKQIAIAEAGGFYRSHPDYFHDLNAMHKAEKVLSSTNTREDCGMSDLGFYRLKIDKQSTAAQRAEAFGLTLGLWRTGE